MIARLSASWLMLGAVLLAGCGHYQLGTGSAPEFATLYVAPVRNEAAIPQAAAVVSAQLREAFLRDGRLSLVASPAEADVILTITLDTYAREATTARADDTGLARKFDLVLSASGTLHDGRTARILFEDRPLIVRRQAFTDSGQLQAEYQTLPLLASSLADLALHAVLDVW